MCTQLCRRSLIARIHLPVSTERSAISSNTGSGASVISAPRFCVNVRQASPGRPLITIAQLPQMPGAADEVELQRGVLLFADFVERDEQGHPVRLFQLVRLHVRDAAGLLRVVAQDADLEPAVLARRGGRLCIGITATSVMLASRLA